MRVFKFGVFCVREILLRAARFSKIYGIRFCCELRIYASRKENAAASAMVLNFKFHPLNLAKFYDFCKI